MESQIVGIRVLALLDYHVLHADIVAVLFVQGIGQRVGAKALHISLDEVEHAVVLGEQDNALVVRLVPIVLAAVLSEILLQPYSVLGSGLPHAAVADLEQHHAVTILVQQVAVFRITLDKLMGIIVLEGFTGKSLYLRHNIFLSLGHVRDQGCIQSGYQRLNRNRLFVTISENRCLQSLDVLYHKGRIIAAICRERLIQQGLKGRIKAIVILALEVVEATFLDLLHAAVTIDGVHNIRAQEGQRNHTVVQLLDDVIAILRGKRFTDSTISKAICDVPKRLNHRGAAKPSQVTTTLRGTVHRLSLG